MKSRVCLLGIGVCLALAGSTSSQAATWYVNDTYSAGVDVYTTAAGNDANSGQTPGLPKRSVNSVLTNALVPGDVLLIDTGTYDPFTVPATVNGAAGNRIRFQGSTNTAAGGTVFVGSGVLITVRGQHLEFRDIRTDGGASGFSLVGSSHGLYEQVFALNTSQNALITSGTSSSNSIRRSVFKSGPWSAIAFNGGSANIIENSILVSSGGSAVYALPGTVSNVYGCIASVDRIFSSIASMPDRGSRNVFEWGTLFHGDYETLNDLQAAHSNWHGNIVATPMSVNADGLDFHLISPAGFVSNGVWVTNALVGYSPAIDFGKKE